MLLVILAPPFFDDDLSFALAVEDFAVEQNAAEPSVEALALSVFPRANGFDASRLCSDSVDPLPDGFGDELRAVVGPNRCVDSVTG